MGRSRRVEGGDSRAGRAAATPRPGASWGPPRSRATPPADGKAGDVAHDVGNWGTGGGGPRARGRRRRATRALRSAPPPPPVAPLRRMGRTEDGGRASRGPIAPAGYKKGGGKRCHAVPPATTREGGRLRETVRGRRRGHLAMAHAGAVDVAGIGRALSIFGLFCLPQPPLVPRPARALRAADGRAGATEATASRPQRAVGQTVDI
eukprot:2173898-Pleurochrysis_carterae.AAC.1